MAALLLLNGIPFLRLRLHQHWLPVGILAPFRRSLCSATQSTWPEGDVSCLEKTASVLKAQEPPQHHRSSYPGYRKWKEKEEEIWRDIEPIVSLTKEILHSDRYMDGECLTTDHEKAVVEKLLVHHPKFKDKIGSGICSIMFGHSRCLFVVRIGGGWIDFSYQKCLRAYIRLKYPSHAERFIREHFKRGS